MSAFLSCPSRKSHTLVIDFPFMKIKLLFKRLDKNTGQLQSVDFKSFDMYDSVTKTRVLNQVIDMINRKVDTESIFQVETFLEHEVTDLSMF